MPVPESTLSKLLKKAQRLVIANAFSIAMLPEDARLRFCKISLEEARNIIARCIKAGKEIKSIVGHQSTAEILSSLLNYPIPMNREFYQFQKDDLLLVFQLKTRLEEGKVLSNEELENLVKKGKAEFWLVWNI